MYNTAGTGQDPELDAAMAERRLMEGLAGVQGLQQGLVRPTSHRLVSPFTATTLCLTGCLCVVAATDAGEGRAWTARLW